MSDAIRAYRDKHTSAHPETGLHNGDLPPAVRRGIESFYTELHTPADAVRVCGGTSCVLAGGNDVFDRLSESHRCAGVYCLGYCDRSPAVLFPDRGVVAPAVDPAIPVDEADLATAPPSIRCEAPEPILTRRLSGGPHHELSRAREAGAYEALSEAVTATPEATLTAIEQSGERGRGGAAYPTGHKWRQCADQSSAVKYVVANGDEGDPGSFVDRVLMEFDPHAVLEGLALCGYAVGAHEGIVYIRAEYPRARQIMENAIREATDAGFLGDRLYGTDNAFCVRVVQGHGSYVCGEETAMLNAIEGQRGEVRLRPPYPVERGLYGRPTVVDNVETLSNIPWIIREGAQRYAAFGTEGSSGTKLFCLNHGFARPGIVEVEYGTPLRRVIEEFGGGAKPGTEIEAVILGGPMGSVLFPHEWDTPVCYDAMSERDIRLGHAGLVALAKGTNWHALLRHWLEFMVHESCGKCVPCRLGSLVALNRVRNEDVSNSSDELLRLFDVIESASLCGFGTSMPGPMRTILDRLARGAAK
jgi:NADH:ubiquinone oxidoreductase subunit F (NADH-binding)